MASHSRTLLALAPALTLAGALLALGSAAARAQLVVADDVVCSGCVGSDDIADKSVQKKDLAPDSVGTLKIQEGAVTRERLTGDAVFGRILVLRADPLDPAAGCDALADSLAGIADNDADTPYLIHLEPGVYDCGVTAVQMKPFVDIEGSGRGVTRITADARSLVGFVLGADNAELRSLTVENRNAFDARAIWINGVTSFRMTDVAALTPNATVDSFPISIVGISSDVLLTDVVAEAGGTAAGSATAILVFASEASLVDVTARTTGEGTGTDLGLDVQSTAAVSARNSVLKGAHAMTVDDINGTAAIAFSQLDGGKDPGSTGTVTCFGAHDGDYVALNDTCD